MPEIVVHHLEHSRSQRILWLLEELGLPYRIEIHKRDPKTMRATDTLRAVHPLGRAPVITVDGRVFAESGAIIETLIERFGEGRLRPTSDEDRWEYRYWMHYAEGSLMTPLFVTLIVDQIRKAPVPFFVKPITKAIAKNVNASYAAPEVLNHVTFINNYLKGKTWLVGEALSGADIQMSYPLEALMARAGSKLGDVSNILAYVARIQASPGYLRARDKVGTFGVPG